MVEKRANIRFCIITGSVVVAALCVWLCFNLVFEPQSGSAKWLFMKRYVLASDKGSALQKYDDQLWRHNGSYIPDEVDVFLCDRFQESKSSGERLAIAEFYALRTHSRSSDELVSRSDGVRQDNIDILMSRLNDYEGNELSWLLVQIENLRRGEAYGKPMLSDGFVDGVFDMRSLEIEERKARDEVVEEVRHIYLDWWERYPTWEERMQHSPLDGTQYGILEP